MEGPLIKRPKLLSSSEETHDFSFRCKDLETLQSRLVTGCLCNTEPIDLRCPNFEALLQQSTESSFPTSYVLQFASTIKLLCELAVSQRGIGFICTKVSEIASTLSADEAIWGMLLQLIGSADKFISYAAAKSLISLLIWTRVPHVSHIFSELLETLLQNNWNPIQIMHSLDVFRGIIEHCDEDEHPLQLLGSRLHGNSNSKPQCAKLEVDEESDLLIEVKDLCLKSLENYWTRLITKFKSLISQYEQKYEYSILTFLSLWQSIVSVKSNLNVVDTKHFYLHIHSFVPYLNSNLPVVLWKKIVDIFNEILCYGSTLSLQDSLPEEPCNLAHLILRHVKSRQFLQGIPYSKSFYSFGGSSWRKPDDSEWESEQKFQGSSSHFYFPTPYKSFSEAILPESASSHTTSVSCTSKQSASVFESKCQEVTTIYIGSVVEAASEELENMNAGDIPLLQKVVILILKSIAITVRETKEEVDSSDEEEELDDEGQRSSPTDSDFNEMVIIERSVREVLSQLDSYMKSIFPYEPQTPLCEWIVKLFSDQDDVLVEGMLCTLDSFTSFIGRIDITTDFYVQLNPVITFIAFVDTISEDKAVILDLLIGNETCFLLYLLRFLKYITRHWEKFEQTCSNQLEKIMELFMGLKLSLENSSQFPYNIDPIIRLLEKCKNNHESCKSLPSA